MTGPRTLGTTPRDHALRMAAQWSEALGRPPASALAMFGVASDAVRALSRTWGASAHDVWSGQGTGLNREDIDAALVWLASRGVLREVTPETARESRYQLAISPARLAAFVARETKPAPKFDAREHMRKVRAGGSS
jgi:hypothetical protein